MNIEVKNNKFEQDRVKPLLKKKAMDAPSKLLKQQQQHANNDVLVKRMQELLGFEAGLRGLKTKKELMFFSVNEVRKLLNARQCFLAQCSDGKTRYRIEAISSMSEVDRNAPIVRGFQKALKKHTKEKGMAPYVFNIADDMANEENQYPFPYVYHLPLKDQQDKTFASLILTRETPWREQEQPLINRVRDALAYAWASQLGKNGRVVKKPYKKIMGYSVALMLGLAGFFPVPLSVLAPVEVTASAPKVITAPFDGVIDEIYVRAGDTVSHDTLLFKMVDTDLVNRNKIAQQDIKIANSRLLRSSRAAYQSNDALQDLAIATTEYELKIAEQKYTESRLKRSKAFANANGVVLFGNKNDLIGKPVATGERIMKIADPTRTEFKIEVALEDSIIIKNAADVRIFLDADPLNPIDAKVDHAALQAQEVAGGQLAYEVTAQINKDSLDSKDDVINPRVGLRGTAQILGEKVPLAFYLFRRPISAIRQWLGI